DPGVEVVMWCRSSCFALLVSSLLVALATGAIAQPPAPSTCSLGLGPHAGLLLTWSDVATETGYRVYRGGVLRTILGPDVTSFLDLDLPGPGPYTYCVEAFNALGTSPQCCVGFTLATPAITVQSKNWYNDTFPANETVTPGTAPFDTAAGRI